MNNDINYDSLISKSLKNVVKEALKIAQNDGLGENHFYITFNTNDHLTKIPESLLEQYPENMTIVLQHQFANLKVTDNNFSVDLSFSGVLYTLVIAFASITYFADPYAKFSLSFEPGNDQHDEIQQEPVKNSAQVISIDSLRKK